MAEHAKGSIAAVVMRRLLQFLIGGILLASALGKSLDLPGFVEVLKTYQAFSAAMLWPLALAVTGIEWALGVWVLSGWCLRAAALAAAGLNGIYAVWMTGTLLRGLELENCGCFGVFLAQPLRWYSPIEDLVLVGLCWGLRRVTKPKSAVA